jgi:NADH dehydrogenase (ubiquinone) 1 alpha subcomplex subunit 8
MPDEIPKVQEIGATSAPLMSASFFIGDRCRAYNDDYMKCKDEANGRGELECLTEGRKVTRCAASVYDHPSSVMWQSHWIRAELIDSFIWRLSNSRIKDINTHCLKQFTAHWECLENNNHRMFDCRKPEMELNNCVFEKIVCLYLFASLLAVLETLIITLWV